MMISSRVSFIPMSLYLTCPPGCASPGVCLRNELVTEVEPAVADLTLIVEAVSSPFARPEQVDDLVAASRQELRDQPPVAPPPERFGAHEAGRRRGERLGEGGLPLRPAHPRRVAPECRDADAGEALL